MKIFGRKETEDATWRFREKEVLLYLVTKDVKCLTPALTVIVAFDPRLIVRPPFLIKRLIPTHPGLPPINAMKLRRSQIHNRTRMDLHLEERGIGVIYLGCESFFLLQRNTAGWPVCQHVIGNCVWIASGTYGRDKHKKRLKFGVVR